LALAGVKNSHFEFQERRRLCGVLGGSDYDGSGQSVAPMVNRATKISYDPPVIK
jgi:hypothetical protein